jgi:hypothetical protein
MCNGIVETARRLTVVNLENRRKFHSLGDSSRLKSGDRRIRGGLFDGMELQYMALGYYFLLKWVPQFLVFFEQRASNCNICIWTARRECNICIWTSRLEFLYFLNHAPREHHRWAKIISRMDSVQLFWAYGRRIFLDRFESRASRTSSVWQKNPNLNSFQFDDCAEFYGYNQWRQRRIYVLSCWRLIRELTSKLRVQLCTT